MITLAVTTVLIYMSLWFLIGQVIRRNDVVDIGWGLGFVILSWILFFDRPSVQLSLVTILVTIWGIRLSTHIFLRNRKKSEDFRYQKWRKEWGKWVIPRSFLQIYMLQGMLLLVVSAPIIVLSSNGLDTVGPVNYIGLFVWLFGFIFESVGDFQLKQFIKSKQKDEVLKTGLWRYTRHPNYFGEVTQWWGIWLIVFGAQNFWFAVIGPATITFLILKVSGIPMLEEKYKNNKEYQLYARKTSKFLPMPVKKVQ